LWIFGALHWHHTRAPAGGVAGRSAGGVIGRSGCDSLSDALLDDRSDQSSISPIAAESQSCCVLMAIDSLLSRSGDSSCDIAEVMESFLLMRSASCSNTSERPLGVGMVSATSIFLSVLSSESESESSFKADDLNEAPSLRGSLCKPSWASISISLRRALPKRK